MTLAPADAANWIAATWSGGLWRLRRVAAHSAAPGLAGWLGPGADPPAGVPTGVLPGVGEAGAVGVALGSRPYWTSEPWASQGRIRLHPSPSLSGSVSL